ncbi:MAG TPA: hypothetical protein VNZ86_13000 [Bacteroidia bacterium]|jgi:putative transposase|nr:hypothetical protein [Bacteroidia bacterium]
MEPKNYFISLNVVGSIDVFTCKEYATAVKTALLRWSNKDGPELQAYVIMNDGLHFIVRERPSKLNHKLSYFKQYTAMKMEGLIQQNRGDGRSDWLSHMLGFFGKYNRDNEHVQFWQNKNICMVLEDTEQLNRKILYVHNLPVNQGIVMAPEHYTLSSAYPTNSRIPVVPQTENLASFVHN